MNQKKLTGFLFAWLVLFAGTAHGDPKLIAIGRVSGLYQDFATQTAGLLENGFPGNRLGGVGSGITYAGGNTFLAIPDRGPNASVYNPLVDNTTSYINRFHTFNLSLAPSDPGSPLPFTLTPMLIGTTLLSSRTPLFYGNGTTVGLGSGVPALNKIDHTHYFTGRSDNFDALQPSTNPFDARFDPEGIRLSNDGKSVFISDEYGPYVYEFDRASGQRVRAFPLPNNLAITNLSSQGDVEIADNKVGRVSNKGMEGLAITPDGRTLVGIMQANLEQDKTNSLRIVTIDVKSGKTSPYAYQLTDGTGASEILAINGHQFLVDERDGKGLGDKPLPTDKPSKAAVKKLYLIDLNGAKDVSGVTGDLSQYAVGKTLFLDIVTKLNAAGIDGLFIPSKLEGMTFGQDIVIDGATKHTLYVANDNDFLGEIADPTDPANEIVENPNQFFVFAFGDSDLPDFAPQRLRPFSSAHDRDGDD
jgi:Esterase-like activity of phytase